MELQRASDRELAERCLQEQSDEAQAAFRVLYQRHAPGVRRFLASWLGPERAADALQETFFRAYVHLDRFDAQRSLRGWLFGVARNVALHEQRTQARRPAEPWPQVEPGGEAEAPRREAQRAEEQRLVREAVGRLPEREREVFLLRQVEGLSYAEVAQATGSSLRTAKYRMRAAADLLAADLGRLGLLGGEA